jgi:hypothetical protein
MTASTATRPADALLVKATLNGDSGFLPDLLQQLENALPDEPVRVQAALSKTQKELHAYLHFDGRRPIAGTVVTQVEATLKAHWPQLEALQVSRLEKVFEAGGASADSTPVFHYVVEMDPEAGWMPELSDWYDTEHMPGLATVPGCVRAARYLNHDHGPLSLACYDLLTEDTLGSQPWLAVRGTAWSSKMRPRFTNTIRTMFKRL